MRSQRAQGGLCEEGVWQSCSGARACTCQHWRRHPQGGMVGIWAFGGSPRDSVGMD